VTTWSILGRDKERLFTNLAAEHEGSAYCGFVVERERDYKPKKTRRQAGIRVGMGTVSLFHLYTIVHRIYQNL